ncbi:DUF4124 domain-containing protein [Marinobacter sp. ANT_B65]|uniref:DUF4124 domain-containing protein n=1 Tax=Marinobacter sp. ANT_B65 TaxID=2039467 RepID=UPI00117FCD82|nr:DUF4124 domain-containing protein [Marinobacter sp. ANT_B65]
MPNILHCSLLFMLAVSSLAQAQVYQWVDESGQRHFSDRPPQKNVSSLKKMESAKPTQAPRNRPSLAETTQPGTVVTRVNYNHPGSSESLKIRRMLEARNFSQLNDLLSRLQVTVQSDISQDVELQAAYRAFWLSESHWETIFDDWVALFPDTYTSYLARASYRISRAWDARGGAYIDKTPQENIDSMKHWLALANSDVELGLSLEPQALWAYCLQINAAKATGQYIVAQEALEVANDRYPANYIARKFYLETLDPKWGGSVISMLGFAQGAQAQANRNPNIRRLLEYTAYEAGRMSYINGEYEKALELLDVAIERGSDARTFHLRAKTYRRLNNLERALKDANTAIDQEEDNSSYFLTRARIYAGLKHYDQAFKDVERASALDPDHEPTERLRQSLLAIARHPDSEFFEPNTPVSSEVDTQDPASLFNFAKQLIANKKFAEARDALDKAISLSPATFDYYKAVDYALFKMGKTQDILEYWARYLSYNPDDGRAYLERSGTHYHLQDFAAAKKDAKRAAELGTKGAAKAYKQLQALSSG